MVDDLMIISKCGKESLVLNSLAQSKIETKRLEFGISKCFHLHVGPKSLTCHDLFVDSHNQMERAEKQRYLGNILMTNNKADENIKLRCDKSKFI